MSDSIRHRARHCGRGRENLFKIKAMNYSFIIYTLFCVFYLIVVGIQLIRSRLFGLERSAGGAERDGRRESCVLVLLNTYMWSYRSRLRSALP